jgi:hypothetical protein
MNDCQVQATFGDSLTAVGREVVPRRSIIVDSSVMLDMLRKSWTVTGKSSQDPE